MATTAFDHVVKELSLTDGDIKKLKNGGYELLIHFKTTSPKLLEADLRDAKLKGGVVTSLLAFQQWYIEWRTSPDKKTIEEDFTMVIWEAFIDGYTVPVIAAVPTASSGTGGATSAVDDKLFSTTYKLDPRDMPLLPKNKSVLDAYRDWEELFMIQMTIGGFDSILKDSWVLPMVTKLNHE